MKIDELILEAMVRATEDVSRFKLLPEEVPTLAEVDEAFEAIMSHASQITIQPTVVAASMDSPYVQAILNIEEV